ncbi:MAG: hypothetical protein J6Y18_02825 [Candidatus Methanomethylophilaceae archaeon]|nr:hypothetical protein [Candidatus Methanomethylophilaceae archaeon]MBP5394825.1 hypothetical protein [Candidatus Methanomethylophilaceae archaeon]
MGRIREASQPEGTCSLRVRWLDEDHEELILARISESRRGHCPLLNLFYSSLRHRYLL